MLCVTFVVVTINSTPVRHRTGSKDEMLYEAPIFEWMYVYLGLRARQQLRSLAPVMKWWWMIMMAKWYSGTLWAWSFLTFILQVRKTPEKTSPRKPVPPGDRTRARCVISSHATTCSTAVDPIFEAMWIRRMPADQVWRIIARSEWNEMKRSEWDECGEMVEWNLWRVGE